MGKHHALIAGGKGFIGKHLEKYLLCRGYDVTVVSHLPGRHKITWYEIERNGIPHCITSVINVSGQNVLDLSKRWTEEYKHNLWCSRINSSVDLVNAIARNDRVHVFINICGVSHYRPHDRKVYTEKDCVEAYDYMSELSLELERASTLPPSRLETCRGVRIRTGAVLGRDGGMVNSLWLPFKLGLGGPLGSGCQILPWIHIEDLCRLIRHCIENEEVDGAINGVAPEVITNAEFSKSLAAAMHRPCFIGLPESLVLTLYGKDRSTLLLSGAKILPRAALDSGFRFRYPTARSACWDVVQNS